MSKKSIATVILLGVMTAGLAAPAFAQQQQSSGGVGGFFGMFTSFFSKMFHPGGQQGSNDQTGVGSQSGTLTGVPTGTMDQGRLQGLVTSGKITQAQEQEILTEVNKIKSEISSWSSSTGIDAGYVYGALRGPGMSAGIGGGQGQTITGMPMRGGSTQGGYNQNGTQGGQQGGFPGRGGMGPRGNQQ